MSVNISFIKLKGKVTDNYTKTLKNWRNKDVSWYDLPKVMGNSNIQFSPYRWVNGAKTKTNFLLNKTNCLVLDVDDGLEIHQFQKMYKKYKYILATTKSHQRDKKGVVTDRYRVIIPAINIDDNADVHFRAVSLIAPFSDPQVLSYTASFLGTDDCIIIKNDGKSFDMFKANSLAREQLSEELRQREAKKIDKDLLDSHYGGLTLDALKEQLTFESVVDILESVGLEVIGNKLSLRDERTKSVKIYTDGSMYDFGDSKNYDIFQVLMDFNGMNFRSSMKYVQKFL